MFIRRLDDRDGDRVADDDRLAQLAPEQIHSLLRSLRSYFAALPSHYSQNSPEGFLAKVRFEMLSDKGVPLKPTLEAILD